MVCDGALSLVMDRSCRIWRPQARTRACVCGTARLPCISGSASDPFVLIALLRPALVLSAACSCLETLLRLGLTEHRRTPLGVGGGGWEGSACRREYTRLLPLTSDRRWLYAVMIVGCCLLLIN